MRMCNVVRLSTATEDRKDGKQDMMQIRWAEIIELSLHLRKYERASSNCHEVNFEAGGKVLYPRTHEALTLLSTGRNFSSRLTSVLMPSPSNATSKCALQWIAHVFVLSPPYSRFATRLFLHVHKKPALQRAQAARNNCN